MDGVQVTRIAYDNKTRRLYLLTTVWILYIKDVDASVIETAGLNRMKQPTSMVMESCNRLVYKQ